MHRSIFPACHVFGSPVGQQVNMVSHIDSTSNQHKEACASTLKGCVQQPISCFQTRATTEHAKSTPHAECAECGDDLDDLVRVGVEVVADQVEVRTVAELSATWRTWRADDDDTTFYEAHSNVFELAWALEPKSVCEREKNACVQGGVLFTETKGAQLYRPLERPTTASTTLTTALTCLTSRHFAPSFPTLLPECHCLGKRAPGATTVARLVKGTKGVTPTPPPPVWPTGVQTLPSCPADPSSVAISAQVILAAGGLSYAWPNVLARIRSLSLSLVWEGGMSNSVVRLSHNGFSHVVRQDLHVQIGRVGFWCRPGTEGRSASPRFAPDHHRQQFTGQSLRHLESVAWIDTGCCIELVLFH